MSALNNKLSIIYNGSAVVEYDRNKALPEQQQEYLDKMDTSMGRGVEIGERVIESPDAGQRLEFVAGQLYQALVADNEAMIAAMCAYIATRSNEATEVRLADNGGQVAIEIVQGSSNGRINGIPVTLN